MTVSAINEKAATRMKKARINLMIQAPFFGTLALRMQVKEDKRPQNPTMWVDGTDLGYNPDWVMEQPIEVVQAAVAQGVMHCALLHQTRRNGRDIKKWQLACDYAVNGLLRESGFHLDPSWPINPAFNGKSAEEIYNLLPDSAKSGNNKPSPDGGHSSSDANGVCDSPACKGDGQDGEGKNNSQCAAVKMEESEWKQNATAAAMQAKLQGKLPAGLERMVQEMNEPVILWRDVLRRFLTEKAPDETNWNRPQRRFIGQGLYLPAKHSNETGVIVAAIDTSGSIGQKELDEFGGELSGIVEDVRPSKLYVIYCDAAINHVDVFEPGDEVILKPHGGGGTAFEPPFDYVEEHDLNPHAFVYLTDGYGSFPTEPEYPVLWAINNKDVVPPWGEHIVLDFPNERH